jgi:hypothetical protein
VTEHPYLLEAPLGHPLSQKRTTGSYAVIFAPIFFKLLFLEVSGIVVRKKEA